MAYKKLSLDRYNERKHIVERLKRLSESFSYTPGVSLAAYEAVVEDIKVKVDAKNALLDALDIAVEAYNAACDKEEQLLIALRACIGADRGKNSDEYVYAGGTRLSEIIALQQQKREEKKAIENAVAK